MSETQIEQLREAMLRQSFLFDDPYSYRCGVEDALTAMRAEMTSPVSVEGVDDVRLSAAG